ncbi:MAG: hypothetical protein AB1646_15515 [Thermodesulfobacteriota bacterium]
MRNLIVMLALAALVSWVPFASAGENDHSLRVKWDAQQAQQEKIRQHLKAIEAEAAKMDESDQLSRTVKPKAGK